MTLTRDSLLGMKRLGIAWTFFASIALDFLERQIMSKRLLDIAAVVMAMPVIAPVLFIVATLVATKLGRPIFFRQRRIGLNDRDFSIVKFRTMLDLQGPDGTVLADAERLTSFGKWLRSTSLDELPELWNVLVGQMSLVGPRPLLPEYLPRYDARQRRRHEVRPGLTGWAQVNGRNTVDWPQRLEMDVWYVENQSFLLDLKILWLTVLTVLSRRGVSSDSHVTMEPFRGTANQDTEPAGDSRP